MLRRRAQIRVAREFLQGPKNPPLFWRLQSCGADVSLLENCSAPAVPVPLVSRKRLGAIGDFIAPVHEWSLNR